MKEIVVKSQINARQGSDFKQIKHKATAGFSEAELIERYTIGDYSDEEKEEEAKEDGANSD